MGQDIFDQVAALQQPTGDVFDQVASQPSPVSQQAFLQASRSMPKPPLPQFGPGMNPPGQAFTTAALTKVADMVSGAFQPKEIAKTALFGPLKGSVDLLQDATQSAMQTKKVVPTYNQATDFAAGQVGVSGPAVRKATTGPIGQWDFSQLGAEAAVPIAMTLLGGKLGKGEAAEGNANTVYHSYLDPIANQPHPLPKMTPNVFDRLANEMETKDPAIAERMRKGTTTIGDADDIRIAANRIGKSAYGSQVPPTMADGVAKVAGDIRDTLYPAIEQAHGLPEGSLQPLKLSQGRLMKVRPIVSPTTDPIETLFNPTKWPGAIGRAAAAGGRTSIENLRTRILSSTLPAPSASYPSNAPSMPPSGFPPGGSQGTVTYEVMPGEGSVVIRPNVNGARVPGGNLMANIKGDTAKVLNASLPEQFRGTGMGKGMYQELIKHIQEEHPEVTKLDAGVTTTSDAGNVWNSLRKDYEALPNSKFGINLKKPLTKQ